MNDMDIAVRRLNKALGKKERILVYVDYDVDGTIAADLSAAVFVVLYLSGRL